MADKTPYCWTRYLDIVQEMPRKIYKEAMLDVQYCPYCGVHAPWVNDCVVIDE